MLLRLCEKDKTLHVNFQNERIHWHVLKADILYYF